jgi:hypothetical protein
MIGTGPKLFTTATVVVLLRLKKLSLFQSSGKEARQTNGKTVEVIYRSITK